MINSAAFFMAFKNYGCVLFLLFNWNSRDASSLIEIVFPHSFSMAMRVEKRSVLQIIAVFFFFAVCMRQRYDMIKLKIWFMNDEYPQRRLFLVQRDHMCSVLSNMNSLDRSFIPQRIWFPSSSGHWNSGNNMLMIQSEFVEYIHPARNVVFMTTLFGKFVRKQNPLNNRNQNTQP